MPQDRVGQWSETLRIMTLGDSITEGPHYRGMIVRTLDGLGCSFDMVGSRNHFANSVRDADHEGYQSWRTDQLADIAADAAANARPDVVIVHAGTNDMAGGRRPATAAAEVDRIVAQLRTGQPSVDIIVAMIIPYDRDGGEVAAFNALVAEQVPSWEQAGPGRVVLANVYDGFDVDWHTTDGVHPNRAGGDFMGLEFVEALQVLYGGCSS